MQTHETESRYPVKESTLRLNRKQRDAAIELLAIRPAVVPGTRAILSLNEAHAWFRKVTAEIERLGLPGELVGPFCDVAGVPD